MTWRSRRQFFILFLLTMVAVGILAILFLPTVLKAPSCTDNKRNQGELGVDCGGPCARYCPTQIPLPTVVWVRAFPTTDTVYNMVAYIKNQAIDAALREMPYEFRLYDIDNILITRIEGKATVMPNGPSAIFAGTIDVGNRIPKRASFSFLGTPTWVKLSPAVISRLDITTTNTRVFDTATRPKLETVVVNNTNFNTGPFDVVGIVYDASGNALAVSKTFVENLGPLQTEKVFMSWPQALIEEPTTSSVITLPNAFSLPQ